MNKLKKIYNNFIKKLAEENNKSFGNEKLDCCGLNRNDDNTKKNKN
ncbi:LDCC motif putative metal-binding protein [Sedimentibacter sp. MB31-C6]|nr:LDCC motif putative metal-binding protein [Sedimentibacter sp. MB36-C1]WSI02977.1 LDCC motif putative metal-binding protein [Sedimentibacter sp. MB36-C1]